MVLKEDRKMKKDKNYNLILILLAAGKSSRYGENKLLQEICGIPMYRRILTMYSEVKEIDRRIVVSQYDAVIRYADSLGYLTVRNDKTELGISRSVKLGTKEALKYPCTEFLFAVCDQPLLKAETVSSLIKGYYESGKSLGGIICRGNIGNPCIFARKWAEELLLLKGDRGGKLILSGNMDEMYCMDQEDESELMDIDCAGDLENLKQNFYRDYKDTEKG